MTKQQRAEILTTIVGIVQAGRHSTKLATVTEATRKVLGPDPGIKIVSSYVSTIWRQAFPGEQPAKTSTPTAPKDLPVAQQIQWHEHEIERLLRESVDVER